LPENNAYSSSGGDDFKLVSQALGGDERAFRELMGRYRQKALGICYKMLGNRVEAEEAAQDAFVKVYFHLKDFDPARDFAVWLSAIAVNECRDRLRRRSRERRTFRELGEADGINRETNHDSGRVTQEKLNAVEEALDKLPEKLREVIILKAYGEHTYEDIARILRIRLGTVMSRLFRARQSLTEIMKRGEED